MKKISVILVTVMLLFGGSLFANENEEVVPKNKLCVRIGELLKSNDFELKEDITAIVMVTINKNKEIVVLHVESENAKLTFFVKGRLNYKKVAIDNFKIGRVYNVPVRIAANS